MCLASLEVYLSQSVTVSLDRFAMKFIAVHSVSRKLLLVCTVHVNFGSTDRVLYKVQRVCIATRGADIVDVAHTLTE